MRKSQSIVFVSGLVAGLATLVACGSGSVGTYSYEQAYEGHPGDFTAPSETNQQRPGSHLASSGKSSASPTNGSSGSSGSSGRTGSSGSSGSTGSEPVFDAGSSGRTGSSGTTNGGCSVCGATYNCQASVGGQTQQQTLTIGPASNNACAISESQGSVSLSCDGGVTSSDGSISGSWTASGTTLVVTLDSSGTTITYDCTKQ